MLIHESYKDLLTSNGLMRTYIYKPMQNLQCNVKFPIVAVFSEIYQVTGPIQRLCRQLASQGIICVAPEVYHEFLPIGKPLIYNEEDTKLGNELKKKKLLSSFDEDFLILLNFFKSDYFKSEFNGKIGCIGMCLGGHLSFRFGFLPEVTAIVCLFPTDIHNANLSLNGDDTLKRVKELEGNGKEVLMIFGKQDDHIPEKGRSIIYHSLKSIDCSWVEVNARHAFTRDEFSKGRYDPAMKDIALSLTQELFHRRLILGLPSLKDILPQPQSKL